MAPSSYRIDRYILNGQDPIPCDDLATWTNWMEGPDRLVRDTQLIDPARNRVRVFTAFLGVDVNFGDGEPILFELELQASLGRGRGADRRPRIGHAGSPTFESDQPVERRSHGR